MDTAPVLPTAEVLGERVKRLRKEAGLTQADVSAALDVSQSTVHRWEIGELSPGLGQVLQLVHLFGIRFLDLVPEAA